MRNFWLFALLLSYAAGAADAAFERVPSERWAQLLRDGAHDYNRQDWAEAFPLVQRAACAGDKTSQAMLGRMLVRGEGTARDALTGYAWIRTAAEFSFADYTTLARKLEEALTPQQRAEGNTRAEALRKDYGLLATGMSCHAESRHAAYILDTVICSPPADGAGVRLQRCR